MTSNSSATGFVSCGTLPPPGEVQRLVQEAHQRFATESGGTNSQVYPALAEVSSDLFGLSLVGVSGNVYEAGDSRHAFTIMSISKLFVFALICEIIGVENARKKVGVNATGLPFNSLEAVEQSADGRTNPMVNSGAIATTSLVPGRTIEAKWDFVQAGLSRFAGRALGLQKEVLASARATNTRNQELARLLREKNAVFNEPCEAVELYTRQCCLEVTALDLATIASTLADGGVNPHTRERVIAPAICHYVLAVMATAGLYDTSGDWLYDTGLPGKSGIGGGIIAVSPGKGGFAAFSPPLDPAGNSVRGQLAAQFLSTRLGLDLFVSRPQVC